MAYLYVNSSGTLDYTTINDALADASNGDTIVIDPGTYRERVYLDRHVNLKGNTSTPEAGDVLIYAPTNLSPALILNYNAASTAPTFYFEGIQLKITENTNDQSAFHSVGQDSGPNRTSLIFNRCTFYSEAIGWNNMIMSMSDTYFDRLIYDHCLFRHDNSGTTRQFYNTFWSRCNDGQILACEYESAQNYYSGDGSPFPHNYVTTPTAGYGPVYGTDYINIPYGYFEGYVKEQNVAVQRELYLHERDTGAFITSTTSDITGYYYMETPISGSHYIVCKDDPAVPIYNDLIIGNAYPTEL